MDKFKENFKEYMQPFWKSAKIVNETVMFVGKDDEGVLLFKPTNVLSVKDYRLQKEYIENVDYKIDGRKLIRLNDSIPYWNEQEYYQSTFEHYAIGARAEICEKMGGKRYLRYGEGDTFTKMQLAVTYMHDDAWDGPIPVAKTEKFTRVINRLKDGQPCRFLFYGDSISTGCNASGTQQGGEIPPFMPPFPELVCEYLRKTYHSKIELINTSVGGMNTEWGRDNLDERVIAYSPDLVFIAFGMNDPATPQSVYRAMIKEMVEKIHFMLPQTEIMLISSIMPNNESDEFWFANQCVFHEDLAMIENEYSFVGFADVTELHSHILKVKRYRDMTANNINHPNDFGHRLYAQTILTTLLGREFDC